MCAESITDELVSSQNLLTLSLTLHLRAYLSPLYILNDAQFHGMIMNAKKLGKKS